MHDPWSSRWWRLLFLVVWTTEMQHLQPSPNTFFGGSSLLRMQELDSSTRRLGVATSLHFFVNSAGWKQKERIDFKLTVPVYKCMHGTARPPMPMYLVGLLLRTPGADWISVIVIFIVVNRTRLSTVGDLSFPVAASRVWNGLPRSACHSCMHLLSEYFVVALRLICSLFLFLNLYLRVYSVCEVTLSFRKLKSLFI